MMSPYCQKMYNEAKANKQFQAELKEAGDTHTPRWHWGWLEKHCFGLAYYGWLLGRGEFDRRNYE